jgi:hypothetical protein
MNWNWKTLSWFLTALAGFAGVVFLIACGGGGGGQSAGKIAPNPAPAITSLSPTYVPAGTSSQLVTINGTGFVASSSVTFNGLAHTTTIISPQQLSMTLSQSDLATPGNYQLAVSNPPPGGGTSASTTFSVWSTYKDQGLGIQLDVPPQFVSYRSTDPSSNQVVFAQAPMQSEQDIMLVVAISSLPQGETLIKTIEDGGIDASSITSINLGGYTYLYCNAPGQGDGTWSYSGVLPGNKVVTLSTASSSFASSPALQDIIASLTLLTH